MKSVLITAICFIVFTIIGTVTHELGHYYAGKLIGLNCKIHYASCQCLSNAEKERFKYRKELSEKYGTKDSIPPDMWNKYQDLIKSSPRVNRLLVTIGGPLQTITTGLFGFAFLIWRQKIKNPKFENLDWLLVFLSLFWLRQPFNLFASISKKILIGSESFFRGDELKISRGLNLWDSTVSIITGLLGLWICLVVLFKLIPKTKRNNFIVGGMIGGVLGHIFWMKILGPIVLP